MSSFSPQVKNETAEETADNLLDVPCSIRPPSALQLGNKRELVKWVLQN